MHRQRIKAWVVGALLAAIGGLGAGACRVRSKQRASPEQAFQALAQALSAQSPRHLFALLDERTRWAIVSTLRAQRRTRELVKAHYPAPRRDRELRRTAIAGEVRDAAAYFRAYDRRHTLLPKLGGGAGIEARRGSGDRVTLVSGGHELLFCRDKGSWSYCGLREHFEQLGVRAARDLATVRESIDAAEQQR